MGSDSTTDLTYRLYRAARAAIDTLSLIPREKADIYQYNINEGKAVMKVWMEIIAWVGFQLFEAA